jgi:hypothetical protein
VPVIPDLAPVVDEIRADVGLGEFVLPARDGVRADPVTSRVAVGAAA